MNNQKLVAIRCLAYNHEKTIRQCLEGFVNQKTKYPFVAIVHDDASTDSTTSIIREYAEKYPDIIKPIIETENQYSKPGVIRTIMDKAMEEYKYIALCEGDDYWIDSEKLEKQIDFLEKHKNYSMCCTNAVILTPDGEKDWSLSKEDVDLKLENLIKEGGLYIPTAGIVYRREIKNDYPKCCINCKVGDHPLQIMCGLKGKVRYFSKKMVAYRYGIGNSWTATRKKQDINKLIASWKTTIDMLEGLNEYSNHKYEKFFYEGEIKIILSNIGNNLEYDKFILDEMLKSAPKCIEYANFKEKIKILMIKTRLTFIWKIAKKVKSKS